mgnify:CR=1 FL=1
MQSCFSGGRIFYSRKEKPQPFRAVVLVSDLLNNYFPPKAFAPATISKISLVMAA